MTSAINPNNIDGAYPVAGQDNSSQGFRDNFTNIKVNFQDAAAEITDLQNKVILKAPLQGQTLDNNMNDQLLYAAKIQDFSVVRQQIAATSGAITVNYASGHYQTILSTTNSVNLSFINFPVTGVYGYMKIQINITNVLHTLTVNAGTQILGAAGIQGYAINTAASGTITFSDVGVYEFGFGTSDGGQTITIFDLNRALTNFTGGSLSTGNIVANAAVIGTGAANTRMSLGNIITTGSISSAGVSSSSTVSAVGNIAAGNVTTVGQIVATGNITGGNVRGFSRPSTGTTTQPPVLLTAGTNVVTPVAGAVEYDGRVFFGTPVAGQRGLLPTEQLIVSSQNYTGSQSASAQKVFANPTNGTVAVSADTTYIIEGSYIIAPSINFSATSIALLFALSAGASLNAIQYTADSTVALSAASGSVLRYQGSAASAVTVTAESAGGNASNFVITFKGVIRIGTAGAFTPQIQFSADPGSAPIVKANSYFKLTPVGNETVNSVGAWT
jgi:hypothetical protein